MLVTKLYARRAIVIKLHGKIVIFNIKHTLSLYRLGKLHVLLTVDVEISVLKMPKLTDSYILSIFF